MQKVASPFPSLQDGEDGDVIQDPIEEIVSRGDVPSHPNASPRTPHLPPKTEDGIVYR